MELEAPADSPSVVVWARDCCTDTFNHQLSVYIATSADLEAGVVIGRPVLDPGVTATLCGEVNLQDSGHQSVQCSGQGNVVFVAAPAGPVQLAEVQVFGPRQFGVQMSINVAVAEEQIEAVSTSLVSFGRTDASIAPETSVSVEVHDIVRYDARL